jgi:hypothetical protein
MKRPFSSRFISRHSPSPLHHSTLSKSATLTPKHEHMPAKRITLKNGLYLGGKAVEADWHISDACGEPDSGTGRQASDGWQHRQVHRARPRTILTRAAMGVSMLRRSRTSPHSISYMLALPDDEHAPISDVGAATATGGQFSLDAPAVETSG